MMMLTILSVLLVIGLMLYGWYRNDLRRITRDYAWLKSFDGVLDQCIVRFPMDEAGTDCLLGANSEGLYISSSLDALKGAASGRDSITPSERLSLSRGVVFSLVMRDFRCKNTFASVCLRFRRLFSFRGKLETCF